MLEIQSVESDDDHKILTIAVQNYQPGDRIKIEAFPVFEILEVETHWDGGSAQPAILRSPTALVTDPIRLVGQTAVAASDVREAPRWRGTTYRLCGDLWVDPVADPGTNGTVRVVVKRGWSDGEAPDGGTADNVSVVGGSLTSVGAIGSLPAITVAAGQTINLGTVPDLSLVAGTSVEVSSLPDVSFAPGQSVDVGSLPDVSLAAGSTVGVSSLPDVSFAPGQSVDVGSLPAVSFAPGQSVDVSSLPAVALQAGTTVSATQGTTPWVVGLDPTGNTVQIDSSTLPLPVFFAGASGPVGVNIDSQTAPLEVSPSPASTPWPSQDPRARVAQLVPADLRTGAAGTYTPPANCTSLMVVQQGPGNNGEINGGTFRRGTALQIEAGPDGYIDPSPISYTPNGATIAFHAVTVS